MKLGPTRSKIHLPYDARPSLPHPRVLGRSQCEYARRSGWCSEDGSRDENSSFLSRTYAPCVTALDASGRHLNTRAFNYISPRFCTAVVVSWGSNSSLLQGSISFAPRNLILRVCSRIPPISLAYLCYNFWMFWVSQKPSSQGSNTHPMSEIHHGFSTVYLIPVSHENLLLPIFSRSI